MKIEQGKMEEYLEVFGGGCILQLHNFEQLLVYEGADSRKIKLSNLDKGQQEEMRRFITAVRPGGPMPISLTSLLETTLTTLAATESLRTGVPVHIANYRIALHQN